MASFSFRYTVMLHCWAKEPNKRPGFVEMSETLQLIREDNAALSKTSLQPLDHFAVPDSKTEVSTVNETMNGDVTTNDKTVSPKFKFLKKGEKDRVIDKQGDTKL